MKKILWFVGSLAFVFTACEKRETDESAVACTSSFGWADTSELHPKNEVLTKLMTDLTDQGLPGISVMLEDSSGIWYKSSGYADIGNQTKMQPCHLVKIASVTKLFTAVMIYDLVDQGKINLDDLASEYIDAEHINQIENLDQTRIRDLLSHSSGIYDIVLDPDFILYTFNNLNKPKSYDEMLEFAHGKEAAFEYNTKQQYNQSLNHVVLAMIINKVIGEDQANKMRTEILNPLGLVNTHVRPQDNIPWDQVAKGYYDFRKEGVLQDLTTLFTGDGRGFTGIYSNVNDMRLFINGLLKEKTLLNAALYNEMFSLVSNDPDLQITRGARVTRTTVDGKTYTWYGHPGGEVNYAAGAFYCPELNATLSWAVNYGIAFQNLGAYTQAYYDFREELFREVSR